MLFHKVILVSLYSVLILLVGACAGKGEVQPTENNDELAMRASDNPLGPPGVFAVEKSNSDDGEVVLKSEKQQGFEGVVDKLTDNPLTLYWRESNAYTYSIGDDFVMRYQPDSSVTLSDTRSSDNSLICQYNLRGDLDTATLSKERLKEQQKACADLMFTFDNVLSE